MVTEIIGRDLRRIQVLLNLLLVFFEHFMSQRVYCDWLILSAALHVAQ